MNDSIKNLDKIKHTVVLMLENRSFDSLLGYLYQDNGNKSPTGQEFEGLTGTESNPDRESGEEITVYPIESNDPYRYVMPKADPGEGYADTISQIYGRPRSNTPPFNKGFVNNFTYAVKNVDASWKPEAGVPPVYPGTVARDIMGMFTAELLPVTWGLAKGYAVCDHWYCSIPTETVPNRTFIACGTSQGVLKDSFKGPYTAKTIFNVLAEKGLTWKNYGYDNFPLTPSGLQQMQQFEATPELKKKYFGLFPDFQEDVANANLADYVFLEPKYGPQGNSMHPNYNVANGEQFIYEVYTTLRNSELWEDTLLILTFDEHGGNYDHVLPPPAVQPNSQAYNQEYDFDFTQFGIRVPSILISAYVEPGSVFRAPAGGYPLSHCSVLSTLEAKYGLEPLTARDQEAPHLGGALSLAEPRQDDPLKGVKPPSYSPPKGLPDHPGHLQNVHAQLRWHRWHREEYGYDYDYGRDYPRFSRSREADDYIRSWHKDWDHDDSWD